MTPCKWSHVHVPASLFLTCCGGVAQSVFQVRSAGSGLVRSGAALSGSRPRVENASASLRDAAKR